MQSNIRASDDSREEEGNLAHETHQNNEIRVGLKVFVRSRFFNTLIHSVQSQSFVCVCVWQQIPTNPTFPILDNFGEHHFHRDG